MDREEKDSGKKDNFMKEYLQQLEHNGYTILPLFEKEEIETLSRICSESIDVNEVKALYASHNRNKAEDNIELSKRIIAVLDGKLKKVFPDFECFIAHFMIKEAGFEKEFPLHQDWNIVDETKYNSYHVWIPLSFTSKYNGGMCFIPGSHKIFKNKRSGSLGVPVIPSFKDLEGITEHVNLRPGNALIYHDALIHASNANTSSEPRISVIAVIKERKAPAIYQHFNIENNTIETYAMEADSFIKNLPSLEKGEKPTCFGNILATELNEQVSNSSIDRKYLIQKYAEVYGGANSLSPYLRIIREDKLQTSLLQDGYAVVSLLDEVEMEALKKLSEQLNLDNTLSKGRYVGVDDDIERQGYFTAEIFKVLREKLDTLFQDYKCPIFQFFIKHKQSDGGIEYHQDSTLLLNSNIEAHYGVWIPLQNTGEKNGTLSVLKGSHVWNNEIVSTSIHWPFYEYKDKLIEMSEHLVLKMGEIVIFDNRLIHSSTVNVSDQDRMAIAGRLTHRLAQYYSFCNKEGDIYVYPEEDTIYHEPSFDGHQDQLKKGEEIGLIKVNHVHIKTELKNA